MGGQSTEGPAVPVVSKAQARALLEGIDQMEWSIPEKTPSPVKKLPKKQASFTE
jgi:hypothetical protein